MITEKKITFKLLFMFSQELLKIFNMFQVSNLITIFLINSLITKPFVWLASTNKNRKSILHISIPILFLNRE